MTAAFTVDDRTDARRGLFGGDDPFALAMAWLAEAEGTEINDPNAMTLATADADGLPNARMVLLKEIEPADDPSGGAFVWYTNNESAKGKEIAGNPQAAILLHWKSLRRQLRARGPVAPVEGPKADAYYATRSLASRLGAWASKQSRPLSSRGALMAEVAKETARHMGMPARPPHWGGFRLRPVEIEFWADGEHRLHDRYRWRRDGPDARAWTVTRLNP